MLDHMLSSRVMRRDGRQRGEEMVKHESKKENISAVHARYRNIDSLIECLAHSICLLISVPQFASYLVFFDPPPSVRSSFPFSRSLSQVVAPPYEAF